MYAQYDAAIGVLKVVVESQNVGDGYTIQESWLAKLGQWKEALERYDHRLDNNPQEVTAIVGKLKCLDALGRWEEVNTIVYCCCKVSIIIQCCSQFIQCVQSSRGRIHKTRYFSIYIVLCCCILCQFGLLNASNHLSTRPLKKQASAN